jgi:hypothetical protein
MSCGTSQSRGVAILMPSQLDYEVTHSELDCDGRYIILAGGLNFVVLYSHLCNIGCRLGKYIFCYISVFALGYNTESCYTVVRLAAVYLIINSYIYSG